MNDIYVNNLSRQYANLRTEILAAVTKTLDSGWYVLGDEVKNFEQEFANYCGVKSCASVANGTDALELSLKACGIDSESEVIVAPNAGMYSTTATLLCGATPVYADIQNNSFNICPQSVSEKITPKTKAIIATHLFGQLCDAEALASIAQDHGIALIEDCAQAHGAQLNGKKAGSWGTCAAFSFYPTKNLGALGDGGGIVSNSDEVIQKVKQLRQYGWSEKYVVSEHGGKNSRLDELQAAILRVKLKQLDNLNTARLRIAESYFKNITNPLVTLPNSSTGSGDFVSHLFVIQCDNRASLQQHLKEQGIFSDIHYPVLDYNQPIMQQRSMNIDLPNAKSACAKILTLPSFPELTNAEALRICEAVNSWE